MKKLKALDLLKDYIEDENRLGDLNYAHYSNIIDYVNEAIDELEALQNRSCNNCLYFSNSGHGFGLCNKGVSSDFKIGTFYCNKWEVKNES